MQRVRSKGVMYYKCITMRDIQYKKYQFRLSEETIERLVELKDEKDISWNLLFRYLLDQYGDA